MYSEVLVSDRKSEAFVAVQFNDTRKVEPSLIVDLPLTSAQALKLINKFCKWTRFLSISPALSTN
jgi:hypothetical protein